jgi:hypothetical protein
MDDKPRRSTTGGIIIGSSYDEARTRKINAEAEIAEMELAKIRLQLCPTEDVVKAWTDVLNACRAKFLSLPTKIAPLLAQEDDASIVKDILESQIHEVLVELSNYDPEINPTGTGGAIESDEPQDEKPAPKRSRGRPKKTERI